MGTPWDTRDVHVAAAGEGGEDQAGGALGGAGAAGSARGGNSGAAIAGDGAAGAAGSAGDAGAGGAAGEWGRSGTAGSGGAPIGGAAGRGDAGRSGGSGSGGGGSGGSSAGAGGQASAPRSCCGANQSGNFWCNEQDQCVRCLDVDLDCNNDGRDGCEVRADDRAHCGDCRVACTLVGTVCRGETVVLPDGPHITFSCGAPTP